MNRASKCVAIFLSGVFLCQEATSSLGASGNDYFEPAHLTGTIYEIGATPSRILFTFRRTATRSGSTIRVVREYFTPAGSIAAREVAVYEHGKLLSYELEELQT